MKRNLVFSAVLISALWLLTAPPAGAFCETRADFCEAIPAQCEPGRPHVYCHKEITEEGLSFMRQFLVDGVVFFNLHNDHLHKNIQSSHFDGCDFDGGAGDINGIYTSSDHLEPIISFCVPFSCDPIEHPDQWGVVALLDPANPQPIVASDSFGNAMHAVQDLYSHSNWVQLHRYTNVYMTADEMTLIEPGVGPWVMQPWAPLTVKQSVLDYLHVERLTLADEDGFDDDWVVENGLGYIPIITKQDGVKYAAVISGTSLAEDECPAELSVDHADLHKDDPNVDVVTQNIYRSHQEAGKLAVRQTGQEWCRILNLTRDRFGFPGVSVPMGFWVRGDAPERGDGSPHPKGTSCAETPLGPVEITVDVDQIRVLNDRDSDDGNPGDLKLVLVLYTHDLTRSSRSEVGPIVIETGGVIGDEASPGPVTLCLTEEQANAASATVQGWDNDNPQEFLDYGDQALRGVHAEVALDALGVRPPVVSEDLEVIFDIERTPTDIDGDGLPLCDELIRGTDPGNAYSDDDDLTDGEEVTLGTNPLDEDTEDDGAEDGDDNCPTIWNADQLDYEGDSVGDACDNDEDNDGVADPDDAIPHSDVSPTVTIESCDSGVQNGVLASGATFMDLIGQCIANAGPPPGDLVSCVSTLSSGWLRRGLISKQEKAAIVACAAFEAPPRKGPRPSATRTWQRR